jgi:putative transferase (TIGR04331 family)
MYQQLNESRLCIGTYNSTTDLETLSRNFPTIVFFNTRHWELRESAKPFFEELREVGIYHETPQSAAAKVNEVYKDPMVWWNSPEVQAARKNFCQRFARTEENWIDEWKKRFKQLMVE